MRFGEQHKKEVMMRVAIDIADLSTCGILKVGAIIVKDYRILSIGYNGTVPGTAHCEEREFNDREDHHRWAKLNEVHAEANAIIFAAKKGIPTEGSYMFCTHSPCYDCAKMVIQSGIFKVFYNKIYDENAIVFLKKNGVEVEQC